MALSTGQILNNRYRIVKLLGQGGFGAVYKGWDLSLRTHCAVKENLDTSQIAQKQFSREARMLANLHHLNLPRVTDYFMLPDQGQYLVMDFVEGVNLQEMVAKKGGRLSEEQAIKWVRQVCDALDYLHAHQPPIIHRDIKPQNIIITPEDRAMLVDFGIAKVYDPQLSTTLGAKAVTPGYSPPEQYGMGSTDARSDVYALGATLYTLLTGQEPIESIQRSIGESMPGPRLINPVVSQPIEAAILKAMQISPSQRFSTISDLRSALGESLESTVHIQSSGSQSAALTTVVDQELELSSQPSAQAGIPVGRGLAEKPDSVAPSRKKLPTWSYGVVGVALLAVLVGIFSLISNNQSEQPDQPRTQTALALIIQAEPTREFPATSALAEAASDTPTRAPATATAEVTSAPIETQPIATTEVASPVSPTSPVATLEGTGPVRLTSDQIPYFMPALSPDQRRMVSFAQTGEHWQIVEIDPNNGGMIRPVTSAPVDYHHPHFSSDGDAILVSTDIDGYHNIYLIDYYNGEIIQQFTNSPSSNMTPYWFPDERSFAFMSNRDGDYEVFIGYLDGSSPKQLTNNSAYDGTTAVSPDGQYIVYYSNVSGNPEIHLLDAASGEITQLTNSPARDAEPVFSPDGEWIAFESNRNGNYDIWVIRPDGSGLRQVTSDPANEQVPVFSPDGKWLFYSSTAGGNYDIVRTPWLP